MRGFDIDIEPDASGATYFLTAAAITPHACIRLPGLDATRASSLQGDTSFARLIDEAGASVTRTDPLTAVGPPSLRPFIADFSDMPDAAMSAAVLACFAQATSENPTASPLLHGLRTLRVKETDRIEALRCELSKVGAQVELLSTKNDESLRITPPDPHASWLTDSIPVHFDTYNDHRMAMSLSLIGLRRCGVFIRNPSCVQKTYPDYWRDLAVLYG
jgi:3-phosphoshikimate 1-carboxyvinyltransferase